MSNYGKLLELTQFNEKNATAIFDQMNNKLYLILKDRIDSELKKNKEIIERFFANKKLAIKKESDPKTLLSKIFKNYEGIYKEIVNIYVLQRYKNSLEFSFTDKIKYEKLSYDI